MDATSPRHVWLWALPLFGAVLVVWLLGPILIPFVIAAGLAYVGDPLLDRRQTLRLSRTLEK